jgi:hypothetical protein
MTPKLHYVIILAGLTLPSALCAAAEAQPPSAGYTWPTHYDFFMPYGGQNGATVYAKPGYQGVNLSLTCKEATGILKMHGYRDIAEVSCIGDVYRFEVSRVEGRFIIDVDPHTGSILRRQRL